jgi:HD-GYP domain-containing protein (c-di-GMP phosphodiesterase class II)
MAADLAHLPVDKWMIREETIQTCNIFFRSAEGKMVLYCASGQKVVHEMCEKIHEHQIERFYINSKDKNNFRFYIENNLDGILRDPSIDTPRKAEASYDSIQFVAEQLFKQPKAEVIRRYRRVIFCTMEFVFGDSLALQNLIRLTTFDFSIYNHSINVGIFSIGLTKEILGDQPEHNLNEVVAGYFLHDIGKCRIPRDILYKRGPLTRGDWKCIQRHVEEGLAILEEHDTLVKETGLIVAQHHERYDGSGYPKGLSGDKIHIYARICAIADVFDGLTSYRPYRKEHSSFDALRIMKHELFKDFDPIFFKSFIKMFSTW